MALPQNILIFCTRNSFRHSQGSCHLPPQGGKICLDHETSSTASKVACDMLPKGEGFGGITAVRLSVDGT